MSSIFCNTIINTIISCLPPDRKQFLLHEPTFNGNEWSYVKDCIDTTMVSSVGSYVDRFEKMLSDYTGVKCAVATVNGTAALHVALLLVGIEAGDEVLVPALTFIATTNAVIYSGAVPHFVDCDEKTLGLDPYKLEEYLLEIAVIKDNTCYNRKTGRVIRAVIPVHVFGHPVDLDKLTEVCDRYKLIMIEDSAESIGSYYKGVHTGNQGVVSTLSFNGNKTITTGGGGAILTNDEKIAKSAKHITTTARLPHKWRFIHDMIGYNYRLPNINAALGCAQLEQLDTFVQKKRSLADKYIKSFINIDGVKVFKEPDFAKSNYWLNALILDNDKIQYLDELLEMSNTSGIMTRPVWTLMNKMSMFISMPRMDLSVAEDLENRIINIPSSPFLV